MAYGCYSPPPSIKKILAHRDVRRDVNDSGGIGEVCEGGIGMGEVIYKYKYIPRGSI
jgi:hypothetical protein